MSTWKLQEAKSKFSDVVQRAQSEGPQDITVRGELVAVLVSHAEYEHLAQPKPRFVELMQRSPLTGVELDPSRQADLTREMALRAIWPMATSSELARAKPAAPYPP